MRVLIIGCGYVGLPLGADLARQGHEVFGLRRSASAKSKLEAAGIKPLFADITRPETLAGLPGSFDWVVNCAASGGGDTGDYRRIYVEGTRNVVEWLSPHPPKKFVYTSSTSVYGQTDGSWVTETSPAEPSAATSRILAATEEMLIDAVRHTGFPAVILRVAGIYGPDRGYWLKQVLENRARIEGKGDRILNMIHRDDVVGCIIAALEGGRPGGIYNAVDDEPASQLDLFRWLAAELGQSLPPSAPEEPGSRTRGFTNKKVSNQKLKTELGYRFKFPTFRQGYAAELKRLRGGAS
jgi:nucleoside-diphosphate-sugar epimerase